VSNQSLFSRRVPAQPTLPRGAVLGTYETYLEAQRIVDRLSKADLDVATLAIVGNDLKTVERITGKLSYARAAGGGAASGAWFGLFLGVVFLLFAPSSSLSIVAAAALIGAGFGMLFGIVSYALNRRRRDFTSVNQVLASNYQVVIEPELLATAQQLLAAPAAD